MIMVDEVKSALPAVRNIVLVLSIVLVGASQLMCANKPTQKPVPTEIAWPQKYHDNGHSSFLDEKCAHALKRKWIKNYDSAVLSYPLVSSAGLFVLEQDRNKRTNVACLSKAGNAVWTRTVRLGEIGLFALTQSDVLTDTRDGFIALSQTDGAVRWESPFGKRRILGAWLDGESLIAVDDDGFTIGMSSATGRLLFRSTHPLQDLTGLQSKETFLASIVRDGVMYIDLGQAIQAFDIRTGFRKWNQPLDVATEQAHSYKAMTLSADSLLYTVTPTEDNANSHELICTDVESGEVKWSYKYNSDSYSKPIVDGNSAIVIHEIGGPGDKTFEFTVTMRELDLEEGAIKSSLELPYKISTKATELIQAVGSQTSVYFLLGDGPIVSIERTTNRIWRDDRGGYVRRTIALGCESMVVAINGIGSEDLTKASSALWRYGE